MSIRYGQKISQFISKKSSSFKKNRNDKLNIQAPPSITQWDRPSDWLTMPTIASSEQKIALLMPVFPQDSNFLAFSVSGAYTVDWGDGNVENISSGVKAQHQYSYTDPDLNATVTSDGYKMAIVVITPQSGQNITSINFNQIYSLAGSTFPNLSPILEIILSCPNLTSFSLGNSVDASAFCKKLVNFNGINMGQLTTYANAFSFLYSLKNVSIGVSPSITSTASMFSGCTVLISVSLFNTASVTTMTSMFSSCFALQSIPLFNTSAVTSMNSMFNGCSSLATIPLLNTVSVTNMASMFATCRALLKVPLLNTSAVVNMSSMFSSCTFLKTVPLFNTVSVNNMSSMFNGCFSLTDVPLLNTTSVTSMASMFVSCYSLKLVPLFNTALVTDMSTMFNGCSSLITIPLFNTIKVLNMSNMFLNCYSLDSIPLFNTIATTNMASMFAGCNILETIPLFNTASVTSMNSMFSLCSSLVSVPLFNTSLVNNMASMFNNCYALKSVPLFDTSSVTTTVLMFANCRSLTTIPLFNTSAVTDMTSMFNGCTSLTTIPLLNGSAGVNTAKFTTIFASSSAIAKGAISGVKYSISYASCKLPKEELESIFNYLDAIGAASQTVTITSNWGAPTVVSLTGTTTLDSTTISMVSTTGIAIGMQVTGTGSPLTTAKSVTFTDVGDLVTYVNHGLSNGDEISFATIVSTTGIVINQIYYVISAAANTFQVSSTLNGSALPLTTNGTGTMRYRTEVVSIVPNVSVTVSRPMSSSGANTLTFRQLKTGTALLKGWAVTG